MSLLTTNAIRNIVLNRVNLQCKSMIAPLLRYSTHDGDTNSTSTTPTEESLPEERQKLGGFAKAYLRQSTAHLQSEPAPVVETKTFAAMLRTSKFIDMGDPDGKIVNGKIFHVVGDDLYIDFGWKFHCVCTRPQKNEADYIRGSIVRLRVKDLELSTRFLGSEKDLTILEADCHLIGVVSTPGKTKSREAQQKN